MTTPTWLKELRAWLGTAALLGLLVVAYFYLKQANADRKEREALMRYVQETTPEEHSERMRKAAQEQVGRDRVTREAEGK